MNIAPQKYVWLRSEFQHGSSDESLTVIGGWRGSQSDAAFIVCFPSAIASILIDDTC
jgi:hypothetical protein